jgi:hypothetical protein
MRTVLQIMTTLSVLKRWTVCFGVAGFVSLVSPLWTFAADTLPQQIDDREFCRTIAEMSEPTAKFQFQLMSNEIEYQSVIPKLKSSISDGGVYLGVGPEQNFTYIAAIKPKIAFIIDVRRDNMLEHLLYKTIFELSANRSEFVSRLFSRKTIPTPGGTSTARELFDAYGREDGDTNLLDRNLQSIKDHLSKGVGCALTEADLAAMDTLYRAFFDVGAAFFNRSQSSIRVSDATVTRIYADLMSATDASGRAWGYLNSEESYRFVREMELKNLIVPVVGDFAGPKALVAIGRYLKDHDAEVSVFYISNVEDYLFSAGDAWRRFYSSVAELPLASNSTIIRSEGRRLNPTSPSPLPGTNFVMMRGSAKDLAAAFKNGQIQSQQDVLRMSEP